MTVDRDRLPRRSVRPSDAARRAEAAERERPLVVRLADRRFTKGLLLALAALEIVNGITLIALESDPDVQSEFSPWITFAVRLALSAAIYVFCYRGVRVAWWLAWIRIGLNCVAVALTLAAGFDIATLAFGLVFLVFGIVLAFHRRVVAFRKDCRARRAFA